MYFNFDAFFRVMYLSFWKWKSSPIGLTPKRCFFLLSFFLVFPLVQLFNACCLILDDIIFPGYRKVELNKPIFIVGNPRSGTTFMHRIMATGDDLFFCFRTWEIIFPAIIQKKTLAFIGRVDRLLGCPLGKGVKRIESRLYGDFNRLHHVSLFVPEEDDKLLMHSFAHLDLIWFFPYPEEFKWTVQLDQLATPEIRKRMMTFYKNCVKRQAYIKKNKGHFLSKSPVASGRVASLYEYFPGCKIIYLVRNPLEVIPSMIDLARELWRLAINLDINPLFQENVYEILRYYYTYPLERLEVESKSAHVVIKYDDLIHHPQRSILAACEQLGIELNTRFLSILKQEEDKAQAYKSRHKYSIDQTHFAREQIVADLHDIFHRFGFDH